mgnify:FL=1
MINNNLLALLITFLIAFLWLAFCKFLSQKGLVSSSTSRKIVHIGTGPIFVLCWLLFSETISARWLASLVPLLITVQFIFAGIGIIKDERIIKSLSRSGDPKEILKGPLYYGIVFIIITILFWRYSPIGIVALMILCGGDGIADLVGSRWGKHYPIPWSKSKSLVGSLGMFMGGLIFSFTILAIFISAGFFQLSLLETLSKLLIVCISAIIVESLPFDNIDNVSVPITAIIIGFLVF